MSPTKKCQECQSPTCPGREKLRHFADWDDVAAHLSEETIVEFINQLHAVRLSQKRMGLKYRTKQNILAKVATKMLDPDELEEIERQATERSEEK